jgi:hypothetical protein
MGSANAVGAVKIIRRILANKSPEPDSLLHVLPMLISTRVYLYVKYVNCACFS